jgi:hypothetical protein
VTYSYKITVDTAPYNLHAEGSMGVFTDPFNGNANTLLGSLSQVASATMHIEIVDGGTTTYDFDSINDPTFVLPDMTLNPGATITITLTATTEAGFVASAGRESLVGPLETVNIQRYGLSQPFISITPEPASLGVLAIGAMGLLMRRRAK